MKRFFLGLLTGVFCTGAYAQETLESVTNRGNIAKKDVIIGTADLSIGTTGSFVQIDQESDVTRIRAYKGGGHLVSNLALNSSGGNVGIGLTSPLNKAHVATGLLLDINEENSYSAKFFK